jgi:hypothetical protein
MPDPAVIDRVDRIWSQLGLDRENGQLNGSE